MQKQKKQLLLLIVILLLAVGGYFFATHLNEKETAESETTDTTSIPVTSFESQSVTKLAFTNDSGTYSFHKDGDNWLSDDDSSLDIDEATITSMVAILAPLNSTDQIDKVDDLTKFGLDAPAKKLLVSDGNTSVTVLVGDLNSTISKYYICLESDMTTVYTMDSSSVTTFDKTLDDCIAQATTETATESEETTVEE